MEKLFNFLSSKELLYLMLDNKNGYYKIEETVYPADLAKKGALRRLIGEA